MVIGCKAIINLILLSLFSNFLHAANGADALFHSCNKGPETYPPNSPYAANLNDLLTRLSQTTPPTGFGRQTVGQANGLALCRGDVSPRDCGACVAEAGRLLRTRCPNQKGAIIWYDFCHLRYASVNFFGQIDNTNKFSGWNTAPDVEDPAPFNRNVKQLLRTLSDRAITTPKFFAAGESNKVYGMVQCTRDLSAPNCKECLDGIIADQLPECCDSKIGGRFASGSCNFRYELYPILK